jgi:kynurenine formamidase
MENSVPSEEDVLHYFERFSNWGRWGEDDQLGTTNHITPAVRADAARLISSGMAISCSRPIETGTTAEDAPGSASPQRFMLRSGEGLRDPARVPPPGFAADDRLAAASEYVGYAAHGYRITHLDGLSHAFWDNQMYNGVPAERVNAHQGAGHHGIENYQDGIVTRGVLVDVPRHRGVPWLEPGDGVTGPELCTILAAQDVDVRAGDALLLRTGYGRRRAELGADSPNTGSAGWAASCLPLFHEWQISLCGADTAQDIRPSPYSGVRSPIHAVGLVAMGMPLIDNADFERLATHCAAQHRWAFFFTVAPLAVSGSTSSAVNPLAVF